VEGTGRLNGRPGYRFLMEAEDGETARLRVRISHVDTASGAELPDYDNGAPDQGRAATGIDRTVVPQGWLKVRG
jgi:hypothetical protein